MMCQLSVCTCFSFGLSPEEVHCAQVPDIWRLFLDGHLTRQDIPKSKDYYNSEKLITTVSFMNDASDNPRQR